MDHKKEYPMYLIGIMGAGKSCIGRELAKKRKITFVDLDKWIEEEQGMSVVEIFDKFGEAKWRKLESEALRNPKLNGKMIVATGGGVVVNEENRNYMKENGFVVWIDRDINSIAESIRTKNRPLLQDGIDPLYKLYEERKEYYKEAHIRFDNKYSSRFIATNRLHKQLKSIFFYTERKKREAGKRKENKQKDIQFSDDNS